MEIFRAFGEVLSICNIYGIPHGLPNQESYFQSDIGRRQMPVSPAAGRGFVTIITGGGVFMEIPSGFWSIRQSSMTITRYSLLFRRNGIFCQQHRIDGIAYTTIMVARCRRPATCHACRRRSIVQAVQTPLSTHYYETQRQH